MAAKKTPSKTRGQEGAGGLFDGREDFIQVFKRGAEFYEELLGENERLRYRNASLEDELAALHKGIEETGLIEQLRRQITELTAERESLLGRFRDVEKASSDYASRYAEIEEEHNTLANLYIASYQLHSTLSFAEVVRIILEIAINLIGIGRLVLYVLDRAQNKLFPVAGDGLGEQFDVVQRAPVEVGQGIIGEALASGTQYISDPPDEKSGVLAVIPLMAGERAVGALVLERFLQQKSAWHRVDHELFTLLGAHAGTALQAAVMAASIEGDTLTEARARQLLTEHT